MRYSIITNVFVTIRLSILILCFIGLTACVTDPVLYSEQEPLQVQTRDLNDIDSDGVINERDLCAKTPNDAVISNDGCEKLTSRPKIKFREINFAFDKSQLSEIEYQRVLEMAVFLNKYPQTNLYLIGDTNTVGSETYNEKLAHRRIKTVHALLIKNDVSAKRLKEETFSMKNHIPSSLTGRKKRLIAVLQWPDDYKNYEVEWNIFTESKKRRKSIK